MSVYARIWRCTWAVVAVFAVALAVLETSALGVLLTCVLVQSLCWVLRQLLPARLAAWPSSSVAIGILAWWSLTWILPWLGVFFVLAAVLSSPAVVRHAVASARRGPPKPAPSARRITSVVELDAFAVAPAADDGAVGSCLTLSESMGPLNGLDDRQLCRLWRESFWVLNQSARPGSVLCLVAVREACLDELERRHAAALHAWLDGGARASGGPEKYLSRPSRRGTELE